MDIQEEHPPFDKQLSLELDKATSALEDALYRGDETRARYAAAGTSVASQRQKSAATPKKAATPEQPIC